MFAGSEGATPTNSILQLMSCFAQLAGGLGALCCVHPSCWNGGMAEVHALVMVIGSRWDKGVIPALDVGALLCAERLVEGSNCPQFSLLGEGRDQLKNFTRVTDCLFSFLK